MISIYSDMNFVNNNNSNNNRNTNFFHQDLLGCSTTKPQQSSVDTRLSASHYSTPHHSVLASAFPSPPPPPALVPSLIPSQHTHWNVMPNQNSRYSNSPMILSHSNCYSSLQQRSHLSGVPTMNDVLPITNNETFSKGHSNSHGHNQNNYYHQRMCSTPNMLYGQGMSSLYPLATNMSVADDSKLFFMGSRAAKQNSRRTSVHTSRSSSPSEAGRSTSPVNKRYSCSVCHKRFTRPSSLTTHMYSHTGEKPFECTVEGCGRKFSVVSNLRRHAKIHNNSNTSSATAFSYPP